MLTFYFVGLGETGHNHLQNGGTHPSSLNNSALEDAGGNHGDDKVKGFRNWNGKTKEDLLETKNKIVQANPKLEPGSSSFNRLLLSEFQRLHPKCMESSRSIYSKVQSVEKELSKSGGGIGGATSQSTHFGSRLQSLQVKAEPDGILASKEIVCDTGLAAEAADTTPDLNSGKKKESTKEGKENEDILKSLANSEAEQSESQQQNQQQQACQKSQKLAAGQQDLEKPVIESNQVKIERLEETASSDNDDSASAADPDLLPGNQLSNIEGFESWTFAMIRDFITCMDSARRKYTRLKEQDPKGGFKLVPLLLDMWKESHPDSRESVKTFHTKIQHLKNKKNMIKRLLSECGLLPKQQSDSCLDAGSKPASPTKSSPAKALANASSASAEVKEEVGDGAAGGDGGFKWNRSMIPDVISSRKRALEIKEQGTEQGLKLSFHVLWADQFRLLHPLSTFTSNNLSVHFWTWRKAQQKLGKGDPLYDSAYALADVSNRSSSHDPSSSSSSSLAMNYNASSWTSKSKRELLELGKHVESILNNPHAALEDRLKTFAGLLHSEWSKRHPNRQESIRSLHMLYSKVLKEGIHFDKGEDEIKAVWTPKHNRVLRECIDLLFPKVSVLTSANSQKIMDAWRKKFPKSSVKNTDLAERITDLVNSSRMDDEEEGSAATPEPGTATAPSSRSSSRAVSRSSSIDQQQPRAPNARGQMCWTNSTITDLFECHQKGMRQRKVCLDTMAKKDAPNLSKLVHKEFLKLHPYCKLSPTILMAKCYCWKNQVNKGTLKIDLDLASLDEIFPPPADPSSPTADEPDNDAMVSNQDCNTETGSAGVPAEINFRTWSQEMIDDMIRTRKVARDRVEKQTKATVRNTTQILDEWWREFSKLYPDYKCSRRNLWRKFRWYRDRVQKQKKSTNAVEVGSVIEDSQPPVSGAQPEEKPKVEVPSIRRDVYLYIKEVMEKSRIYLPKKLPKEPELNLKSVESSFAKAPLPNMVINALQPQPRLPRHPNPHLHAALTQQQPSFPPLHQPTNASETLAQFHQQALQQQQDLVTISEVSAVPLPAHMKSNSPSTPPMTLPPHIKHGHSGVEITLHPSQPEPVAEKSKRDSIKLPGGATLVAVTDRNVDTLLKPKPIERPHVTITTKAGLEQRHSTPTPPPAHQQPLYLNPHRKPQQHQPPQIVLPINVPKFNPVMQPRVSSPSTVLGPPQLAPGMRPPPPQIAMLAGSQALNLHQPAALQKKAIYIPSKVKSRCEDLGLTDQQFLELLSVYEKARNEFFDVVQRGYLAFFPFILESQWASSQSQKRKPITAKKLECLVELYIEEKNKSKINDQEYLTKKPCGFEVTEDLLNQILVLHEEVSREMSEKNAGDPNPALVYHEMCKRWQESHSELKITTKQLISIYEMVTFNPKRQDSNPEIACLYTDIWRQLERFVPGTLEMLTSDQSAQADEDPNKHEATEEEELEEFPDDSAPGLEGLLDYDEETVGMDQLQELVMECQNLERPSGRKRREIRAARKRPRRVEQNVKRFWTLEKLSNLERCRLAAMIRCKVPHKPHLKKSMGTRMFLSWKSLYPNCKLSKEHLLGKAARQVRLQMELRAKAEYKLIQRTRAQCEMFYKNEERNETIDEDAEEMVEEVSKEDEENIDPKLKGSFSSLSKIRPTHLPGNANRNFNNWEDVIDFIREVQKLSTVNTQITWTPDVIRDLIQARLQARQRKSEWEAWAKNKFGGVGMAYAHKDAKFVKVDDMFHEEWAKIRPDMAHLSVWTIVAYARKFDGLQRELIVFNKDENKVPTKSTRIPPKKQTVYFPDSGLPVFDLDILAKDTELSPEIKDLIATRQRAKIRQKTPEEAKYRLTYLWEDEWRKIHPDSNMTGYKLQRVLYRFELDPNNTAYLKVRYYQRSVAYF